MVCVSYNLKPRIKNMKDNENRIYLNVINEIAQDVYDVYNSSGRNDLIMLYGMDEERLYSYVYDEFMTDLNLRSQKLLKEQYEKARQKNKIVLFIRDKLRNRLKSFTI